MTELINQLTQIVNYLGLDLKRLERAITELEARLDDLIERTPHE